MEEATVYQGREQTQLKHLVLKQYLSAWAAKLSSVSRGRPVRIWYVDCFAGPWRSRDENIQDTSVAIGLHVLNEVLARWNRAESRLEASAIFVELDAKAHDKLRHHVDELAGGVDCHVIHGRFEQAVPDIEGFIGGEAAFVFIDPTGWKGVGMEFIARLVTQPRRDVMINLMYDHIHRFQGDEREWLREQFEGFFGVDDATDLRGLDESGLVRFYASNLKKMTGLRYALNAAIPSPTANRTLFHLILGASHSTAVELFRNVEKSVVGRRALDVRARARAHAEEMRTGQMQLGLESPDGLDPRYRRSRDEGMTLAREEARRRIARAPARFDDLWPAVLEEAHVTKSDLGHEIVVMARSGDVLLDGLGPRQRSAHDHQVLRPARTGSEEPR